MDDRDLQVSARVREQAPDGWTGRGYADAPVEQGRLEEAEEPRWRAARGGDEPAIRYGTQHPHEELPA